MFLIIASAPVWFKPPQKSAARTFCFLRRAFALIPPYLLKADGPMPDWLRKGVEAALLAPMAMNQQKFFLTLAGD